jgi:hypothetical protein
VYTEHVVAYGVCCSITGGKRERDFCCKVQVYKCLKCKDDIITSFILTCEESQYL